MKSGKEETSAVIRRFLIMGSVSAILHGVIAAFLFLGMSREDEKKVYRVEVRRLQSVKEQAELPELKEQAEIRKEPEKPAVVDLAGISAPISPAEMVEETIRNADIVETPVPPVENAIITPGGGLGSGADEQDGGGNSLLATGTGSGFGGAGSGEGWGGGSGSPGTGGGTGGGYGSGTGNSRGRAGGGTGGEETGVYFAGMSGIINPEYQRTPQPSYPKDAKKRGEEGDVLVKAEVLADGRVGHAEVAKSSGFASLDEAALGTVMNWRFKPALKGREEVVCWINIPIRFRLRR